MCQQQRKRYNRAVCSLFDPRLKNDVLIAAITSVEIVGAITRRSRGGSIIATDAIAATTTPNV
ncbi:hypothetical protein [Nostoc sp. 'Peltigera membranacea cyanobiont' 210A]|uniref:hypothetical protein n=1 Tax=Nostoc sp. 'Peltigera membranacea cyanobiont' 210A TaxID=2014529 RepID=UPI001CB947DF|nr:hypothetical protein [Nostoc sp. 'Peltigera membranacea cyanobiont' 210A]